MNFDEMILEAAKSIAAATSTLVKAASSAQRELIDSGKMSRTPLTSSDDGQWSEGLISAARLVAAATHSLVESANALVQGALICTIHQRDQGELSVNFLLKDWQAKRN